MDKILVLCVVAFILFFTGYCFGLKNNSSKPQAIMLIGMLCVSLCVAVLYKVNLLLIICVFTLVFGSMMSVIVFGLGVFEIIAVLSVVYLMSQAAYIINTSAASFVVSSSFVAFSLYAWQVFKNAKKCHGLKDFINNQKIYGVGNTRSKNIDSVAVSDKGIVTKDLKPFGSVKVGENTFDAKELNGHFVKKGQNIEVVKIDNNILIVKERILKI